MDFGLVGSTVTRTAHRNQEGFELAIGLGAGTVATLKPLLDARTVVAVAGLDKQHGVPHNVMADWVLYLVGNLDELSRRRLFGIALDVGHLQIRQGFAASAV